MSEDTNLLKALHAIQEADAALVTQEPRVSEAVAQLQVARRALHAEMNERLSVDMPPNSMVLPKCIADAIRRGEETAP